MRFPFAHHRRRPRMPVPPTGAERDYDADGVTELLAECPLLRERAADQGVVLSGDPESLALLDQLPPLWREDPEELPALATDAGLYLGTVIVRSLAGARWVPGEDGRPEVALASGRRLDVGTRGREWAENGVPELSRLYAEAAEG
ncbi:DUF6278 family protein [Streptomyces sp. ST2-7A]|uniref:DUF6278 family protein n=1 Tax=Streptomyces sp. ST2-7A TaxID=2907214 RepID=UPI001F19ED3B|nr:DUF6278 family protein [Streptomyces sp. ST2-7A]MCE7081604.1 DUF6278 family protein [Streptomyces sp. ST2-7A]